MEPGSGLVASRTNQIDFFMNPDRWQEVKRIFAGALDRAADERVHYLDRLCQGDDELRREVESLLGSHDDADGFMDEPAVREVADEIVATQIKRFSKSQEIAHYRIVSELGTGGQGAVYKALDTKLGRTVALKLLPPEVNAVDDTSRKRFQREAQLASSLDHPNICTVHDLMEVDGATFIVMQFVAGRNVRQLVEGRPLEVRHALRVGIQVCDALAAAHSKSIIHRDIKAQNVIVTDGGQAKILDFGLAKLMTRGSDYREQTELTAMGSPYGTPTYAAPEQSRGEKVDHRADIFSAGVLLYEMLAGTWPFQGKTAVDVRHAVLYDEPKGISERRGTSMPERLEAIVSRALSKDPANRYQHISQMRDELIDVLRNLPEAQESSTQSFLEGFKSAKFHTPRLGSKFVAGSAALLIVIAAVLAYGFYLRRPTLSALTGKDTILIADFSNTTGDPVFDDTLRQGLALQLQQSSLLNIFPNTKVRDTLRQMERKEDERVTVEIGREICQRNDLKALIAGSIAPLGSHYVITLEAINARSGDEVARQQVEAESKEQVLKSLSSAASGIREQLGESLSAIHQSDIPLYQLTTPSLEALKSFALGFDRSNKGEYFESIPLFKHAVELDPNFAYGYSLVAGNYIIMTEPRRAAENAAKAFALKDKVTDREKLYITYVYDNYALKDLDKAEETLRLYNQSYPNDFRASGNLSLVYQSLGQFDKSYDAARESVRLNPGISHWQVTLGTALLRLNRFGEAKTTFQGALQAGLDDPRMHATLYQLAFIDRDTSGMQQQLDWAHNKPEEFFAADLQTAAAAYEGRWRQSQDFAQQAIELAARVDFKEVAARFAAEQGLRAAVLDRCEQARTYDAQSLALDRNQVTLERIALAQALCGAPLQSSVDELARENPSDTVVNRLWLPIIRAAIEFKHGNAAKTIELLNGARSYEAAGDFWPQYLRGEAYLKLNKGAEAVTEFQSIRDHRGLAPLSALYPLASYGLGEAAALKGDKDDSLRSYESFLTEWKDADRDLMVLIDAQRHAKSASR